MPAAFSGDSASGASDGTGSGVNGCGVGSGEVAVGANVGVGRNVPSGAGLDVSNSGGGVKKKGVMVVRSGAGETVQAVHRSSRARRRKKFLDTCAL